MTITSFGRWVGLATLLTLALATSVDAQPASEVFLGYSFLQANTGGATFDGVPIELESETMHGTEASGTYFTGRRLGWDFVFGLHNGEIAVPPGTEVPEGTDLSIDFVQYAFMAGPRVRVLSTDTLNFDVRAVVGVSKGNARAVAGLFALEANNTVLAAALGASLTLKLGRSFGFRVAQPEVYVTRFGDATQTSFRVSTGIVFVYGGR